MPRMLSCLPVYDDDVPVFFGHYWLDPVKFLPTSSSTRSYLLP